MYATLHGVHMDKTGVAAKLHELASGNEQRTEVAKLRAVFDDVEAALAAGVKRAAILQVLCESGLKMNQRTFDTQVYRIRQSRKAAAANSATARPEKADKAPSIQPMAEDGAQVSVKDEMLPADNSDPLTTKDSNVRYPDIQRSQEKARRYINGPLAFDVDHLFKKGNQ